MRKNVAVIVTVVLAASLATTTGYTWYKYKELKAVQILHGALRKMMMKLFLLAHISII